jgi:hypothetical protein
MLMRFILICTITIWTASCASGQKEKTREIQAIEVGDAGEKYLTQLEQDLTGTWVNESMRVWVKSYNHSDTSFIVDINSENWEMKMTIKPIRTQINADGTYLSEFRNSFDSLIYRPKGTWFLDGDSLIMEDQQAVYRYQVFIDGDRAEFRSLVDWDDDGANDDEYFGVQRKIDENP